MSCNNQILLSRDQALVATSLHTISSAPSIYHRKKPNRRRKMPVCRRIMTPMCCSRYGDPGAEVTRALRSFTRLRTAKSTRSCSPAASAPARPRRTGGLRAGVNTNRQPVREHVGLRPDTAASARRRAAAAAQLVWLGLEGLRIAWSASTYCPTASKSVRPANANSYRLRSDSLYSALPWSDWGMS